MKRLGYRVTANGAIDNFELRQAAIECATLAAEAGWPPKVEEVLLIETALDFEDATPPDVRVGDEWARPIKWSRR